MIRVARIVALASATGRYGGPFDTSLRQVRIATACGFESLLVAGTERGDEPTLAPPLQKLMELHPVKNWLPQLGFSATFSVRAMFRILRRIRGVDVVHVSVAREVLPVSALVGAVISRKRIISQPHGMLTSRTSIFHRITDIFLRPLVAKSHVIIALTEVESKAIREWLGNGKTEIVVLGNPVPDEVSPQLRARPVKQEALFIARLHPRKRVDVFLNAALEAEKQHWPENYTVVGPDGGDIDLVEAATAVAGNVTYEGAISGDEVTRRVQDTGVFVLSSVNEPWGNVVAIAVSAGVPVVVPTSAALSAKITQYGAGIVVPDGDDLATAAAVHKLLEVDAYARASQGAISLAGTELSKQHQVQTLTEIYSGTRCRSRAV